MSDGNGLDFGSISSINAVVPGDDNDFKKPVILQGYYSFFGHKKLVLILVKWIHMHFLMGIIIPMMKVRLFKSCFYS